MDWITDTIAIGSRHETRDPGALRRASIRSVPGLISSLSGKSPADLGVERVEVVTLLDGPGNDLGRFCRAVDLLADLVAQAPPVLVHCRAGWSRSPAVVAAYLVRQQGLSADQALAEVVAKRACSMVPDLGELVRRYARECS